MKVLKTPFHESISASILNSRDQEFTIWGEPAYSQAEIYQNLNYRKALLQTMFLLPKNPGIYRIRMYYNFNAEMITVNTQGFISGIMFISEKAYPQPITEIHADGPGFHILAKPGFWKQFGLEINQSTIRLIKSTPASQPSSEETPAVSLDESTEGIVDAILSDRAGKGLRSKIPYVYVWNNDVLFIVNKISFPGYCASRPATEAVFKACEQLKAMGIAPVMKEAVYPRMYLRKLYAITAEDTWWGMENQGKFVQTNMVD